MQDVWRIGPEVGGEEVADGRAGDLFEVGLEFGFFGAPVEVGVGLGEAALGQST